MSQKLHDAQVIQLWNKDELDFNSWSQPEEINRLKSGLRVIRNVSRPTLTAYLPDSATQAKDTAVIICPGGAYHFLAYEHEGIEVARWLNKRGIAAFLLKYRLVQTGDDFPQCVDENLKNPQVMKTLVSPLFPIITADGCQAVRLVRQCSAEWGLSTQKIGLMGFSAGGMLTLSVGLHFGEDSRPDFCAPVYAAPPLDAPIPSNAPPLFLLCAADDEMASEVSTKYYTKWRKAGHPVELHIYAKGGHGFGMNRQGLPSDDWIERFIEWMHGQDLL